MFCRPMISCKAVTKILYGNSEKRFSNAKKMALRNIFRQFFCANFSKSRSGSCNFSFLKNSLVQINCKLNSKPYDYLYKHGNKTNEAKLRGLCLLKANISKVIECDRTLRDCEQSFFCLKIPGDERKTSVKERILAAWNFATRETKHKHQTVKAEVIALFTVNFSHLHHNII